MSKLLFFLLLLCQVGYAEEKLVSKQITPAECPALTTTWICYDDPSAKKIDNAQAGELKCNQKLKLYESYPAQLKTCNETVSILQSSFSQQLESFKNPEWYQAKWFHYSLGAAIGLAVGFTIGVSL